MLLIATDEAGYGPKLGPLVVAATIWKLPGSCQDATDQDALQGALQGAFAGVKQTYTLGHAKVVVDDSKAVFKPTKPKVTQQSDPLSTLHATVSVANRLANTGHTGFSSWLAATAPLDIDAIQETDWLRGFEDHVFVQGHEVKGVVDGWSNCGLELLGVLMRVIPAAKFNQACTKGMNKADLLSESTLGLIRDLIQQHAASPNDSQPIAVFCDRHGGRRYYAGVLQHVFADANVQVIGEAKSESKYHLAHEHYNATIQFNVKGDSFTPVAMSSIYAKYTRERMMEAFNQYFAKHHRGSEPLTPTAGYPTDADRFLRAIEPIVKAKRIDVDQLVRSR